MPKTKTYLLAAITWLIIVTVLLTIPGSSIPKVSWFHAIQLDKWVHVGIFAILIILWCGAMKKRTAVLFLELAVAGLAYGIAMEFVQKYFIPNRSFDLWDITADAGGCVAGLLFSISRYLKK